MHSRVAAELRSSGPIRPQAPRSVPRAATPIPETSIPHYSFLFTQLSEPSSTLHRESKLLRLSLHYFSVTAAKFICGAGILCR